MKFLDNISLLKLSGLEYFIFLDLSGISVNIYLIRRWENLLRINKNADLSLKIVDSCIFEDDPVFKNSKSYIKKLVEKYGLKDPSLIIGINDFRFSTRALPADTDDVQLWFTENTGKFLPEGQPAEEFVFSYQDYKKDEHQSHYFLVIARTNYIETIQNALSDLNIRILALFPFQLSILEAEHNKNNTLYIDLKKDRISFCFINHSILYKEIFISEDTSCNKMPEYFDEIKQYIIQSSGNQSLNDPEIYIDAHQNLHIESKILAGIFNNSKVHYNPAVQNKIYFSFVKLMNSFDSGINLLSKDLFENGREYVEKKSVFRLILGSAALLIIFLIFDFGMELYFSSRDKDIHDVQLIASLEKRGIEKLEKENVFIRSNISLVKSIKNNKLWTSAVMKQISEIIPEKCFLTDIKISEEATFTGIELNGYACFQQNIVDILAGMEAIKNFKDIKLVYSSSNNHDRRFVSDNAPDLIKFCIRANCYEN